LTLLNRLSALTSASGRGERLCAEQRVCVLLTEKGDSLADTAGKDLCGYGGAPARANSPGLVGRAPHGQELEG